MLIADAAGEVTVVNNADRCRARIELRRLQTEESSGLNIHQIVPVRDGESDLEPEESSAARAQHDNWHDNGDR